VRERGLFAFFSPIIREELFMTTTRTPGPWLSNYSPYTAQDGAEIPAFEIHGTEKVCDTNEDRPVEEQEANARLIAAAPDMLEALEFVRMMLADIEAAKRKGYYQKTPSVVATAIAKAIG
jgi:hypothetical protein